MSRVIWKYTIPSQYVTIDIPIASDVLSVGMQGSDIVIWAVVFPNNKTTKRRFAVRETGEHFQDGLGVYIGTVTSYTGLVHHVFEVSE